MSYKRKTRDVWAIFGYYAHGFEEVCREETRIAAIENLHAYRMNEMGTNFIVRKLRERIEA